jgi:hypothetical protein
MLYSQMIILKKNLIIESLKSPEKFKKLNDYRFSQKRDCQIFCV